MSYLSLKPRIFPSPPQQPGSPAFVLVDTTLIRIIGKPDLIHIAGLLGHRFSANWAVSSRARILGGVQSYTSSSDQGSPANSLSLAPRERKRQDIAAGSGRDGVLIGGRLVNTVPSIR